MTDSNRQAAQSAGQPSWKTTTTPEEHEDFPGQMLVTRDPHTIMAWARKRDAVPVMMRTPGGDRLDRLRLDVRGSSTDGEPASWDEWLATFMAADLRFVYQEQTADGELSTYYRFDPSAPEEGGARSS